MHLVEAAAQLHLVRDVVVNVEHLRFSVAAVGHQEFNVEIIAFVQVVSGQRTLNLHVAVAGNPGVHHDEGDEAQSENHHLLIGNHHANEHQRNPAGEGEGCLSRPHGPSPHWRPHALMRLTSATVCSRVYLLLDSTANLASTGSLIIDTSSLACMAWNSSRLRPF